MARAIDVRVVARAALVFDVGSRYGDPALTLFRCFVDIREVDRSAAMLASHHLGDRGGQRGLAMIDVTDGADVAVRLVPLEFFLGHFSRNLCLG